VRDLTKLPPGAYEIVQAYDLRSSETVEEKGVKGEAKESRTSHTFTFDLAVEGKPPVAVVTVRRVEIRIEQEGKTYAYDSDGPAADQAELIREQFRHLVGRKAKVDLAEFGKGKGFSGLDAAWADYLKENPGKAGWAEANRNNYGDGRIDRLFTRGLDVLFGPDAGRAHGRSVELRPGQTFEVTLKEPGIGFEPTALAHACTVRSAEGGNVVVEVRWHENGVRPKVDESGAVIARGGDMKSTETLTFRVDGGFLVAYVQDLERADQVGSIDWQKTRRSTERIELAFRRK
jgi:hypothetical protein